MRESLRPRFLKDIIKYFILLCSENVNVGVLQMIFFFRISVYLRLSYFYALEKASSFKSCFCFYFSCHDSHVVWQHNKRIPLGTKLFFLANSARVDRIVLLTNMAALSSGCKPRMCKNVITPLARTHNVNGSVQTTHWL